MSLAGSQSVNNAAAYRHQLQKTDVCCKLLHHRNVMSLNKHRIAMSGYRALQHQAKRGRMHFQEALKAWATHGKLCLTDRILFTLLPKVQRTSEAAEEARWARWADCWDLSCDRVMAASWQNCQGPHCLAPLQEPLHPEAGQGAEIGNTLW